MIRMFGSHEAYEEDDDIVNIFSQEKIVWDLFPERNMEPALPTISHSQMEGSVFNNKGDSFVAPT